MRGSIRVWTLALAAAILAAGQAAAQGFGSHGHGPGGPGLLAHLAQKLDLTDEQHTQIKAILSKYMDGTLGDKLEAMRDARENLGATIHDAGASDRQVQDAVATVSTLEPQLAVERHHMALEIQSVLSAAQRAKLTQLREERGERGFGPPPPPDGDF